MKKNSPKASRAHRVAHKKASKTRRGSYGNIRTIPSISHREIGVSTPVIDHKLVDLVNTVNDSSIQGIKAKTDYLGHVSTRQIQEWYSKSLKVSKSKIER